MHSAVTGKPRVRIGTLEIDRLDFDEALDAIEVLVTRGRGGAVFTPNVDHVVVAERDAAFRSAYAQADLSLADGTPVVWAARLFGTALPARVAGSDLVEPLLRRAAARGWRVYLLGAGPGVGEEAARRVKERFGLEVVGVDAPRIPTPDGPEAAAAAERAAAAGAQLVVVGLGAPKQELFIHHQRARLGPAVALGLGACIDFLAGRVPRAPRWMARVGLEWAWRLLREPRRLWRRYLVEDVRFLGILWRQARSRRSRGVVSP